MIELVNWLIEITMTAYQIIFLDDVFPSTFFRFVSSKDTWVWVEIGVLPVSRHKWDNSPLSQLWCAKFQDHDFPTPGYMLPVFLWLWPHIQGRYRPWTLQFLEKWPLKMNQVELHRPCNIIAHGTSATWLVSPGAWTASWAYHSLWCSWRGKWFQCQLRNQRRDLRLDMRRSSGFSTYNMRRGGRLFQRKGLRAFRLSF